MKKYFDESSRSLQRASFFIIVLSAAAVFTWAGCSKSSTPAPTPVTCDRACTRAGLIGRWINTNGTCSGAGIVVVVGSGILTFKEGATDSTLIMTLYDFPNTFNVVVTAGAFTYAKQPTGGQTYPYSSGYGTYKNGKISFSNFDEGATQNSCSMDFSK